VKVALLCRGFWESLVFPVYLLFTFLNTCAALQFGHLVVSMHLMHTHSYGQLLPQPSKFAVADSQVAVVGEQALIFLQLFGPAPC